MENTQNIVLGVETNYQYKKEVSIMFKDQINALVEKEIDIQTLVAKLEETIKAEKANLAKVRKARKAMEKLEVDIGDGNEQPNE